MELCTSFWAQSTQELVSKSTKVRRLSSHRPVLPASSISQKIDITSSRSLIRLCPSGTPEWVWHQGAAYQLHEQLRPNSQHILFTNPTFPSCHSHSHSHLVEDDLTGEPLWHWACSGLPAFYWPIQGCRSHGSQERLHVVQKLAGWRWGS